VQKLTAFAAGDQTGLIISQRFYPALFPLFVGKARRISGAQDNLTTPLKNAA
jgi:hypothetical protein